MRKASAAACCTILVLAAACEGGTPPISEPSPEPTAPQPLPAPTAARSIGDVDSRGRYEVSPISAPVEVGVPYAFNLFTRCGLDLLVDFNGALWDAVGEAGDRKSGPPRGFETPRDIGVMVLVNQELAEFTSSTGEVVSFIRQPGRAKKIKPCLPEGS